MITTHMTAPPICTANDEGGPSIINIVSLQKKLALCEIQLEHALAENNKIRQLSGRMRWAVEFANVALKRDRLDPFARLDRTWPIAAD